MEKFSYRINRKRYKIRKRKDKTEINNGMYFFWITIMYIEVYHNVRCISTHSGNLCQEWRNWIGIVAEGSKQRKWIMTSGYD